MELLAPATTRPGRLLALVATAGVATSVVGVWALKLVVAAALGVVPA